MDPYAHWGRVADVALGRLCTRGFALTTLDDIARAARVGEAELRAVFGDVEGLMRELVSPLLDRLREVALQAAAADLHQREQLSVVIEAYLDALVAHRVLVGVVLGDPAGRKVNRFASCGARWPASVTSWPRGPVRISITRFAPPRLWVRCRRACWSSPTSTRPRFVT